MSWVDDLDDKTRESWDQFVTHERESTLKQMTDSTFVMSLVPKPGDIDIKFAVELGMAIMLNKPIMALVLPGAEVPEKLRLVADEIVVADLDIDSEKAKIGLAISRMMERIKEGEL